MLIIIFLPYGAAYIIKYKRIIIDITSFALRTKFQSYIGRLDENQTA